MSELASSPEINCRVVPLNEDYAFLSDMHDTFLSNDCTLRFPSQRQGDDREGWLHHDTSTYDSYMIMERAVDDIQDMAVYEIEMGVCEARVTIKRRSSITAEPDAEEAMALQDLLGLTVPNDEEMDDLRRIWRNLVEYIGEHQSNKD